MVHLGEFRIAELRVFQGSSRWQTQDGPAFRTLCRVGKGRPPVRQTTPNAVHLVPDSLPFLQYSLSLFIFPETLLLYRVTLQEAETMVGIREGRLKVVEGAGKEFSSADQEKLSMRENTKNTTSTELVPIGTYNGGEIMMRRSDHMLDVTNMCRANGKEWRVFRQSVDAKRFLQAVCAQVQNLHLGPDCNYPEDMPSPEDLGLIVEVRDQHGHRLCTLADERIGLRCAAWIKPDFELWVIERIEELMTKGYTGSARWLIVWTPSSAA